MNQLDIDNESDDSGHVDDEDSEDEDNFSCYSDDIDNDDYGTDLNLSSSLWDESSEFEVGMLFSSREAVKNTTKKYHMLRHPDFCNEETTSKIYATRCSNKNSNYKWRMRESRQKSSDIWKITRYNGPHACSNLTMLNDHCKLDSKFIYHFIMPIIQEQLSIKILDFQAEFKDKIDYESSYSKTWKVRHMAIVKIYGGLEESYGRLRRFMIALCKQNPKSPVLIEDEELFINSHLVLGYKIFDRMF
ncbi:uncharacterized protein LOC131177562 [Hevea brasiliensis]|uniref:uncharacterized protein LOC131177562 n=1 Tax=Hevea brasiliensis TaxID=3981 RepID=UPI0025F98783|nr:uncharacterized protein LOC131177562 [Hevea brasiliensis]